MVTGAPGNGQVSLAWSPPASDGGSPIAGYKVTVTSAAGSVTTDLGLTTTTTVGLLTNGIAYTFTVAAYNAAGAGTGPASNSVTATPVAPVTAPGAPTGLTATVGNGSATLGWTAPASDGGSAITEYIVTVTPAPPGGALISVPGTTATVTGLTNGQSYTFTVAAKNVAGTGSLSVAASAFMPRTVPGAPHRADRQPWATDRRSSDGRLQPRTAAAPSRATTSRSRRRRLAGHWSASPERP